MDNKAICERCGYVWQVNLNKDDRKGLLCSSCTAKPAVWVQQNFFKCKAHQGDFARDESTPMKNGEPYLPGRRICNKLDCVNPAHIVSGTD